MARVGLGTQTAGFWKPGPNLAEGPARSPASQPANKGRNSGFPATIAHRYPIVPDFLRLFLDRFLSQPPQRKPDCLRPDFAGRLLPAGEPRKPGDPGLDFIPAPRARPGGLPTFLSVTLTL